jgi:hypothetical protein
MLLMEHNFIFLPIQPTFMGGIVLRLVDFDESPIDKYNATLKLWNFHNQYLSFFDCGPLNLDSNGKTN